MNIYLFISITIPLCFSPGPANISLANHSLVYGFDKTIGYFCGLISSSFIIVVTMVLFYNKISPENKTLIIILQLIGSIYISFLAYKLYICSNKDIIGNKRIFTYYQGFILNFTNSKFYIMVSLLITQFPVNNEHDSIMFILLFIVLNAIGNILWMSLGSIGSLLSKYRYALTIQKYIYSIGLLSIAIYIFIESAYKLYII